MRDDRPTAAASAASGWALLPLRLFLGATFTYAGLQKLANPAYLDPKSPTSVQATILSLQHRSPIGWLLATSAHAPKFVGVMIAAGELAVGLATLLGLWVRLAALGGALLSLTFFLTVSFDIRPYYYGSDIGFLFAWSVPLIAGRWGGWTVDDWIRQRSRTDADPQRRALVMGGTAAGALAVSGGLLGGLTAVIGRALNHSGRSPASLASNPAPSRAPTRHQPKGGKPTAAPGRQLVAAATVPAGQAEQFTDDQGSPAWLVHESDGTFKAFSAVCTHAGCTVGFSNGEFVCPCHGGTYSAATGGVLIGPPPAPLPQINVEVVKGQVRLL